MRTDSYFLAIAAKMARSSTCARKKCGAVVVVDDRIVAGGWNGPAPGTNHRCFAVRPSEAHPRSDRTCCVHAEWRALLQYHRVSHVLSASLDPAFRARLYFARLDDALQIAPSGPPYCTVCSRLALEVEISAWVMAVPDGIRVYPALEFDALSHEEPAR